MREITGFSNNVITYELGVGRKINDSLSVFARIGYEKSDGEEASRLSPTDGRRSFGIGGSWSKDNVKVTGGVEYLDTDFGSAWLLNGGLGGYVALTPNIHLAADGGVFPGLRRLGAKGKLALQHRHLRPGAS